MINTFSDLRTVLKIEKKLYPNRLFDYLTSNQRVYNWRFVRSLRYAEFFYNKMKNGNNLFWALPFIIVNRIKNRIGQKIGVEIDINGGATIGKNCQLH